MHQIHNGNVNADHFVIMAKMFWYENIDFLISEKNCSFVYLTLI
jgi:hypothetical protein